MNEPIRMVLAEHHRLFELPGKAIVYCAEASVDFNGMVIVNCNEEDVSMLLRDLHDRAALVSLGAKAGPSQCRMSRTLARAGFARCRSRLSYPVLESSELHDLVDGSRCR